MELEKPLDKPFTDAQREAYVTAYDNAGGMDDVAMDIGKLISSQNRRAVQDLTFRLQTAYEAYRTGETNEERIGLGIPIHWNPPVALKEEIEKTSKAIIDLAGERNGKHLIGQVFEVVDNAIEEVIRGLRFHRAVAQPVPENIVDVKPALDAIVVTVPVPAGNFDDKLERNVRDEIADAKRKKASASSTYTKETDTIVLDLSNIQNPSEALNSAIIAVVGDARANKKDEVALVGVQPDVMKKFRQLHMERLVAHVSDNPSPEAAVAAVKAKRQLQ